MAAEFTTQTKLTLHVGTPYCYTHTHTHTYTHTHNRVMLVRVVAGFQNINQAAIEKLTARQISNSSDPYATHVRTHTHTHIHVSQLLPYPSLSKQGDTNGSFSRETDRQVDPLCHPIMVRIAHNQFSSCSYTTPAIESALSQLWQHGWLV